MNLHDLVMRRPARFFFSTALLLGLSFDGRVALAQAEARPAPSNAGASRAPGDKAATDATQTRSGRRSTKSRRRSRGRAVAIPALRHTTPRTASALTNDLHTLLTAKVRSGTWGVMVVSLTRGDTLYSLNAGEQLMPASTMKLFTAALAFEQFGPAHQFTTDILRDGTLTPDGTLEGNLVVRGGGDPAFSDRFVRGTSEAPLATLAGLVAGAGIKHVRGDLIADATAFESQRVPDGWLERYLESSYAARVSPLTLNENLATVVISPARGGGAAVAALDPPSSTIPVVTSVRTTGGTGAKISVRQLPDGRIEARGWIGARSVPRYYLVVVDDPAIYTAGALASALKAQGITIDGRVRLDRTPTGATTVTALPSPPLARLASVMNRESINIYGELLFRNAARQTAPDGLGSAREGNALLNKFMTQKVGASADAVYAADGSGLSTLDRTTSRALVQLLSFAHRSSWAADFHASLPVAGESELLRHRMRFTPAHGNLHAKTGTTNDVIALGGYVTAQDGEVIAFSFIYNGRDRWNAREAIDASGATLAAFVRE